jgi:signal transduction histidine kinase
MNVIVGWIEILISGKSVRDTSSILTVLQRNATLQARMIDELLDMSRLTSGNIRLDLARIDIASILHATIQGLGPTAEARFVSVHETTPPQGVELDGDARRIEQILRNVLDNAIKFTPKGGHVYARAERVDGDVSVTVEDDGCGISPSFLPFVFERFRQEDAGTTRQSSGLGLGLAIVKHLVELHGGTVSAHSDGTGRGAIFTVRLPANLSKDQPLP